MSNVFRNDHNKDIKPNIKSSWSASLFDTLKTTQNELKETLNRFKAENDEFKRQHYSKMNEFFEIQNKNPQKSTESLLNIADDVAAVEESSNKENYGISNSQSDLKKCSSFLNDESSEDDEEFSGLKYPPTRYSFTDGKIFKLKTVSFDENLCSSSTEEDKERRFRLNSDVKIKRYLRSQPVKSILKKPSTFNDFSEVCDKSLHREKEAEFRENNGFFVWMPPLNREEILKRTKSVFEPALKFF